MADVPSINSYKRGFCPFSDRPIYMYGLPVPSSAASASAASWPTSTCYPNRPVTFCIATEHQKMLMGTVNHLQIIAMLLYYRRICEKNLLKSLTWFAKSEIQVNLFCNHQYFHFVTLSRWIDSLSWIYPLEINIAMENHPFCSMIFPARKTSIYTWDLIFVEGIVHLRCIQQLFWFLHRSPQIVSWLITPNIIYIYIHYKS